MIGFLIGLLNKFSGASRAVLAEYKGKTLTFIYVFSFSVRMVSGRDDWAVIDT